MKKWCLGALMMATAAVNAKAADIALPSPNTAGGGALMEVIGARRSQRNFDAKRNLSEQDLADLLWATWGISSDKGLRVVPTARNLQNIDLYVLRADGVYLYEAKGNTLKQLTNRDLRSLMLKGQQFAFDAPVHLLFVTDDARFGDFHAGSMYQNAGLFCADRGLSCVVRAMYDADELKKERGLIGENKVVMSMAIGYPAK